MQVTFALAVNLDLFQNGQMEGLDVMLVIAMKSVLHHVPKAKMQKLTRAIVILDTAELGVMTAQRTFGEQTKRRMAR